LVFVNNLNNKDHRRDFRGTFNLNCIFVGCCFLKMDLPEPCGVKGYLGNEEGSGESGGGFVMIVAIVELDCLFSFCFSLIPTYLCPEVDPLWAQCPGIRKKYCASAF
jgi:hypothetical protein